MSEQVQAAAPAGEPLIPAGGETLVSTHEARVGEPPAESYSDQGPITTESWTEKVKKFHGKKAEPKTPPPAAPEPAAAAPAVEKEPKEAPAPKTEEKAPGEAPAKPAEAPKFKANTKYNVMGKEYEFPKHLAGAIENAEQETELRDVYTKAMALDHTKARHQETQDKLETLTAQHNGVVDGLDELKAVYAEAQTTGNPLILNDFFARLKIPPQAVLQYAHALAQYLELPPDQQQQIDGQLNAHRQARTIGKQNQSLQTRQFQSEVQARTQMLDSALAKPEIVTVIQAFEAQPGRKPGDFKEQVIRNGIYTWHQSKQTIDLPLDENIKQVMAMFGLNAAQAPGAPAAAPQAPAAAPQVPAASATPPPAAPQAPGAKPVVPAQPHRDVPTIPGVNGKSSSPTKQGFRSLDELKQHRKEKFGH